MDLHKLFGLRHTSDHDLRECLLIAEETAEYNAKIAKRAADRANAYREEIKRREDERKAKATP